MSRIIKARFLWLAYSAIVFLPSCNRQKKECEGKTRLTFEFDIPYTITPMQDTFSVGDTIWMEFAFSNQMYNKNNGKTYTVNNFEFKMYGYILDLKTNIVMPTNDFTMLNKDSFADVNNDRHGALYHINTQMEQGIYRWKAGFIMAKTGWYAAMSRTEIGNDGNLADQSPSQHITECPNEGVSLDFLLTNGNGNSYFLDYAADENPRSWNREAFEKTSFAFYVKE